MNRDAFEKHAMAALDGLYSYALRLVRNPEDAADLVQETFAKSLNRLDGFGEAEAVRPVLFRILYNCFVDSWRKKKRRLRLVALPASDELGSVDSGVSHNLATDHRDVLAEALSQEVDAALGELEDELRETLWLREIEDFSYAEIAKIMDVPIGTVRSRLSRARVQMAANLQNYAKGRGYIPSRIGEEGS